MRYAVRFAELTYSNPSQPRLKRWIIRSIETLSGRERYADLYDIWRGTIVPSGDRVFSRLLELIGVRLATDGPWPPERIPDGPLMLIANHPFGIGDGIAMLSLAERLGRPFRVLINDELLKIPEIEPYSLPVCFEDTREAMRRNMETRRKALQLIGEGVTIVVFPAGGVATAPRGFGRARDLPWKMFPARLIQMAQASVIPIHFEGQNGPLFHLASRFSLTLRTSLLIREFARLSGRSIHVRVGEPIGWEQLSTIPDRYALVRFLQQAVFSLAPPAGRAEPVLRTEPKLLRAA
ncbi:MAG: lysophospholipid acyltransferase family protein [Brucellaceae bacterium]|nr:lysophospholipid acyltransferase family protein [Brucellaceae bacterium]